MLVVTMKLSAEHRIPASPEVVWAALNDVDVLRRCLPGCRSLGWAKENEAIATVATRIGPMSAHFRVQVVLSDLDPPHACRMSGEGTAGAAGFARGQARVRLTALEGGATHLRYDVEASVGGKLAQLGQRLIETAARKLADEFFTTFATVVANQTALIEAETGLLAAVEADAAVGEPSPELAAAAGNIATTAVIADQDITLGSQRRAPPGPAASIDDPTDREAPPRGLAPAVWVPSLILVMLAMAFFFSRL